MNTAHHPRLHRVGVWLIAFSSAAAVLLAVRPNIQPLFAFLMFVALSVISRIVWGWVLFERSPELDRKIPVSSKELRRRKKQFFDSLQP